jgi:Tfp pilus assembly protein PilX
MARVHRLQKYKKNESGMVLIIVLMTIVVMMVFSMGVISRGVSQTKSSQGQIDRIKAEELAVGAYAKAYSERATGAALTTSFSEVLDNRTFTATVVDSGPSSVPATNAIGVTAPY